MNFYLDWVDITVCCNHGYGSWRKMWTDGNNVICPECGQEYIVNVSIIPYEEIPPERLEILEYI